MQKTTRINSLGRKSVVEHKPPTMSSSNARRTSTMNEKVSPYASQQKQQSNQAPKYNRGQSTPVLSSSSQSLRNQNEHYSRSSTPQQHKLPSNQESFSRNDHEISDEKGLNGEKSITITLLTSFLSEGEKCLKNRNWERGIISFTKALEYDPSNKYAFVCRSKCHMNLGAFDKGIEDAEQALEIDPTYHRAYLAKAECLYASGKFEYALVYYYKGYDLRKDIEDFKKGIRKAKIAINESIEQDEIDRNIKNMKQPLYCRVSTARTMLSTGRPSSAKSTRSVTSTTTYKSNMHSVTIPSSRRVVSPREVFQGGKTSVSPPPSSILSRPSSARHVSSQSNTSRGGTGPFGRPQSAGPTRNGSQPFSNSQPSSNSSKRPISASNSMQSKDVNQANTNSILNTSGNVSARSTYSFSRPPSSQRPKSATTTRKEKYLLGEFTKDEEYLSALLTDKTLRKSMSGDPSKKPLSDITNIVQDTLEFLDKRKEFWRHSITTGSTTSAIHVTPTTPTPVHASSFNPFRKDFFHNTSTASSCARPKSANAVMSFKGSSSHNSALLSTANKYSLFV
ncbi:hypothetical protein C9374_004398 [Naegleria lovaniensis]|uniref:Outer dynein arm-docking complex subunit 4 n=1 Tax=Naegleria lovaniensis TaxID=51637 RepID=A0AA88KNX3_NAELO|nr:uncharacterized protein C9374_004398 [Naegleria lovaniensis]KAG2383061.1 hypothetical protein C9374_004398 [Naegleria lovaniensis]